MASVIRIIILGDLVGTPGQMLFCKYAPILKEKYGAHAIIVNGENSANGKGITSKIAQTLKEAGAVAITTGNHIWQQKEIADFLITNNYVLRPENFPTDCPGSGVGTFRTPKGVIGVLNLQGRVFMRELLSCPFKTADAALQFLRAYTSTIIVDMHAETTSEKLALAYYLSGKVSAVVGTHTHVQTADERILPGGTAYISDLGMAGALNSMIGMKKEPIIHNYITQMPVKFLVDEEPPFVISGVYIDIDMDTGKATHIERIRIIDETLKV